METAGIYGLGKIMGHECLSINALIANRATLTFSEDPKLTVDKMIEEVLEVLTDKMSMI
jgi:uridine phosphorylase